MQFIRKYGAAFKIRIPVVKAGSSDFAVGADWTPAAGDVKISKDGGAAADITTLPSAIAMGNGAIWEFAVSATEAQAAEITITVVDSATKAVQDQALSVITFGNASAGLQPDWSDSVRMGLTALPNAAAEAAGGLFTRGTGAGQINQSANGQIDVKAVAITNGIIAAASFAANALDAVWSTATRVLTAGTNIVLAKGTGVTGFNDLSAAQVNAEADTALADAGVTTTVTGRIDAAISTRLAAGSYTAPLDAAGVRSAVGLASANLDTQLGAIAGYVDTEIGALQTTATAIKNKTDNLPASPAAVGDIPTGNQNADALLDRADAVETGWTIRQAMRIVLSALGGKASGLETTTAVYRNATDSKARITATVDTSGNRTAVTLDAS